LLDHDEPEAFLHELVYWKTLALLHTLVVDIRLGGVTEQHWQRPWGIKHGSESMKEGGVILSELAPQVQTRGLEAFHRDDPLDPSDDEDEDNNF
jgi:hypothetical protein